MSIACWILTHFPLTHFLLSVSASYFRSLDFVYLYVDQREVANLALVVLRKKTTYILVPWHKLYLVKKRNPANWINIVRKRVIIGSIVGGLLTATTIVALFIFISKGAFEPFADPSLSPSETHPVAPAHLAIEPAPGHNLQPSSPANLNGPNGLAQQLDQNQGFAEQVFFGDLHIHTELSTDAYIMGVRSKPEDVYRFAKGQTITHGAGYPLKISRPLDFVAVTDHAEYMGQARVANLDIPTTQQPLAELLKSGSRWQITQAWLETSLQISKNGFSPMGMAQNKTVNADAWQTTIAAAERHYEPGKFTTFIGYEWSGDGGSVTQHMHRNVIFKNNKVPKLPFSQLDSNKPEDLWAFLEEQRSAGVTAMAIPHNGNFSLGKMYAPRTSDDQPIDAHYAKMRAQYEPITEILQIKGSSETHPLLSSEDEFADFEILSTSLFIGDTSLKSIKGGYLRDALKVGLELQANEGFNPFKYGVIGSSDSHNANSPADEDNYTGKLPILDGSAGLRTDKVLLLPDGINPVTSWGSGALAAVWAEENTRASIFAALQRRETYATSGPRIRVRFFAGWYPVEVTSQNADFPKNAYASGVAMGGNLYTPPTTNSERGPTFLISAMKDPLGANLDRVQIIKGWVDEQGKAHEKVFDVASSDARIVDQETHRLASVGNSVDVSTATYSNNIGGREINTRWHDPEYVYNQQAFYYARVLEIPTPRWSTYDAKTLGIEPMQPTSIQERAITSAIWLLPN